MNYGGLVAIIVLEQDR